MNEFSWEKLQQFVSKEKFTLTEAINALIDNQEELDLSEDDLTHIIAILFQLEVDSKNCLLFTTFSSILRPRDLAEARQIIKEYKEPISVNKEKYGFSFFDENKGEIIGGFKVIGVDKAKEAGDSTSIIISDDLTPVMKELAEARRKAKETGKTVTIVKQRADERALRNFGNKLPLFLRNPDKNENV